MPQRPVLFQNATWNSRHTNGVPSEKFETARHKRTARKHQNARPYEKSKTSLGENMDIITPYHCTCPQEIRTENRRNVLRCVWRSPEWIEASTAYKARHPPVCSRCGREGKIVPGHCDEDYKDMSTYIQKVRDDQVPPLCSQCNRNESKGRHPCPECVGKHQDDPAHKIHYIGQGKEVCYFCEPGVVVRTRREIREMKKREQDAYRKLQHRKYNSHRVWHACDWHGSSQRCGNPLRRDRICPYSSRDAADRCDPDYFMARKGTPGMNA